MNFNEIEQEIIKYWDEIKLFDKLIELNKDCPKWEFLDGPPFCNGVPHHGHLLVSSIKDTMARYMYQRGYNISYQIGFDCHGLPLEQEAEKTIGKINPNDNNEKLMEFNNECRKIISNCSEVWYNTLGRLGRQFDKSETYYTSNFEYMESLWWAFKKLWDDGLIYKSKKVMPYSPLCETPLSNFEASSNYQERTDISVYVKFKIMDKDEYLLIWTTTPWSLIANQGICVNPEYDYCLIEIMNEKLWICSNVIDKLFNDKTFTVIKTIKGNEFIGTKYEPIFKLDNYSNYNVYCDNYVQNSSGTGIVHLAPLFGDDDMRVMKMNGYLDEYIPNIVNSQVKYNIDMIINNNNIKDRFVMDCSTDFVIYLKNNGYAIKSEKIKHNYPYCWRTDYPLIYLATDAWFMNVQKIIPELIENNKKIVWYPLHVGTERFANWIKDSPDWCLSRNRIWGTPIPVWINENGDMKCIGSVKELEELTGNKYDDLHLDNINNITFNINGNIYKRTFGILDCWFESGMAGLARFGYPECENKSYPVDFIAESVDQTRGWFYTLNVLSTALNHKPAYKKVIVSGLILAADGKKMSKRLNNYTPPSELIKQYGVDILRLYLIGSPAAKAESFCFKDQDLMDITRKMIPYYNAHLLLKDIKNNDNKMTDKLDIWIINKFMECAKRIYKYMDNMELTLIPNQIYKFIDNLCNLYIKLSRNKIKKGNINTLIYILNNFNKLLVPFTPHLAEYFNKMINNSSIHLEKIDFEYINNYELDNKILDGFYPVNELLECVRNMRQQMNKPIFYPIEKMEIYIDSNIEDYMDIIYNELNIKNIEILSTALITKKYKANRGLLGKEYKKEMNKYATMIETGNIEWDGCNSDYYTFEYNIENKNNMIGAKFNFNNNNNKIEQSIIYLSTNDKKEYEIEAEMNNIRRQINDYKKTLGIKFSDKTKIIIENNKYWEDINENYINKLKNKLNSDIEFINKIDNPYIIETYNNKIIFINIKLI